MPIAGMIRENASLLTTSAKLSNRELVLILTVSSCLLIAARFTLTRVFFLEKCARTAAKTMVLDRTYRKALVLPCPMSEPFPNAANSSDVLRLDSMLRELRKLLCYDKRGCFSWENVFGPPQKPWLWTEKTRRH